MRQVPVLGFRRQAAKGKEPHEVHGCALQIRRLRARKLGGVPAFGRRWPPVPQPFLLFEKFEWSADVDNVLSR